MAIVGRLMKALGKGGYKVAVTTTSGPSSYSSGGFNVTISQLSSVSYALAQAQNAGYLAVVASVSGNTVKVKVMYFDYDASADGAAIEVASGTDLSSVTFTVVAFGS